MLERTDRTFYRPATAHGHAHTIADRIGSRTGTGGTAGTTPRVPQSRARSDRSNIVHTTIAHDILAYRSCYGIVDWDNRARPRRVSPLRCVTRSIPRTGLVGWLLMLHNYTYHALGRLVLGDSDVNHT